jgi:tRNA A-37 threonylcarbamoyl transferase component Bud32
MNYNHIEKLSYTELKKIAEDMDLKPSRTKEDVLKQVVCALKEYENYKKNNVDKYTKIKQLGNKGKEGITYLVTCKNNNEEYAMKTFRKQKSSEKLRQEVKLQELASTVDISPKIIDVDTVSKYIVMDKMDKHLVDVLNKQNGILNRVQQKQLINIYKKLDDVGVFHSDANLLNYMFKGKQLYIIDFGMAKEITNQLVRKLGTTTPNLHIMTLGLILKLKELNCPETSYDYLSKFLSDEQKEKFNI